METGLLSQAQHRLLQLAMCCGLGLLSSLVADAQDAPLPGGTQLETQQDAPPGQPLAEPPPLNGGDLDTELSELEALLSTPALAPALEQEVTTVSGQQSTVGKSPAAVFVVTPEMIRRSGARSIPEALRVVPGLQVARGTSNKWTITSRGFNFRGPGAINTSNKLLVLIDGRTVYSPFSGTVFWDVQDVLLEDIARIEVIRGPGATIWGANAVNGVINVITKTAAETQGGLVTAGGGSEENGFTSGRVGGQIGDNAHFRVYGKWFERDASFNPIEGRDVDDWRQARGGFRVDWAPDCCDTITLQGDLYQGRSGFFNEEFARTFATTGDERVQGGNLLTRWTRQLGDDSDISLQMYYDRADRLNNVGLLDQRFDTYDAELRHHLPMGWGHNVVWGLGYRVVSDDLTPTVAPAVFSFAPSERTYETFSFFAQDEITLAEDELFLTLGTKLQHNDFSGFEVQPSGRLLWSPDPTWAAWASVSRAVRTPARTEHDLTFNPPMSPVVANFTGAFESEEVMAYELGYRAQPVESFSWDVAVFYNQYENLQSFHVFPPPPPPPIVTTLNADSGAGYGVELSAKAEITPCWRLSGTYSFLKVHYEPGRSAGSLRFAEEPEGTTPQNQVFLMSSHDLGDSVEFDLMGRYVDSLPFQSVSSYISLDTRLAWRATCNMEFAVVGQNLLDAEHAEYNQFSTETSKGQPFEIQRSVYGMVTVRW